jgi:hypothetical protein
MILPDPAEVYRKKAEDCRREAERAVSPLDRQRWIQLAGDWMKLAKAGESWTDDVESSGVEKKVTH